MTSKTSDSPSSADSGKDAIAEADLDRVMQVVPRGTLALTGLAVAITLAAWLILYFGVFIPRGAVN